MSFVVSLCRLLLSLLISFVSNDLSFCPFKRHLCLSSFVFGLPFFLCSLSFLCVPSILSFFPPFSLFSSFFRFHFFTSSCRSLSCSSCDSFFDSVVLYLFLSLCLSFLSCVFFCPVLSFFLSFRLVLSFLLSLSISFFFEPFVRFVPLSLSFFLARAFLLLSFCLSFFISFLLSLFLSTIRIGIVSDGKEMQLL